MTATVSQGKNGKQEGETHQGEGSSKPLQPLPQENVSCGDCKVPQAAGCRQLLCPYGAYLKLGGHDQAQHPAPSSAAYEVKS